MLSCGTRGQPSNVWTGGAELRSCSGGNTGCDAEGHAAVVDGEEGRQWSDA